MGTLGVLGALGVSALLLSKMRKEKYPKEEQVEDLRKAKEEQDRAVQNLSRELNKIKGLMIFDSDVCKSYKNLVSFLEKTCKYSPDTKKCVSKRISEYRLNTTDINEAVKILKCI
ncbi:MAG TPA: hypothetical protein V6C58_10250 [Allocoleopsis sp.]